MDDAELHRLFSDLWGVRAQLVEAVNLRLARDFGFTATMLAVMQVIQELRRCRVRELAAALGVSAGGASKLVDRLETLGHCRRIPNPGDRRSSLLELTEGGRQVYAGAAEAAMAELARQLGPRLSESQIGELGAILSQLRSAAADRTQGRLRQPDVPDQPLAQ
jgi:MarR family transcriptional regulator, organic hydroperoxide resistance regulator